MKAIKTTVYGPTNISGTRIAASDDDHNKIILNWDHSLNGEGNSKKAAFALASKLNWKGHWVCGALKNHYVWVCVPDYPSKEINDEYRFTIKDMKRVA